VSKAIHTILTLNIEGKKELLGLYLSDQEGAHQWLSVLTGLYNRGDKYPLVIAFWRNKWPTLTTYFKYPDYVQKVIYATNAVEAVHRQFRKLTKTKGGFANENSLLKLLYAGIMRATERWTHPVQNWNLMLSQMAIHFGGQVSSHDYHSRRLTRSFSHSL